MYLLNRILFTDFKQFLYPSESFLNPTCGDKNETPILRESPPMESRKSLSTTSSTMTWMNTVFAGSPGDKKSASVFQDTDIPKSKFSQGSPQLAKPKPNKLEPETRRQLSEPEVIDAAQLVATHSRNPSVAASISPSVSPSLTPSLLQHLERNTMSPEPVLGIAVVQRVTPRLSTSDENQIAKLELEERPTTSFNPSENPVPPQPLLPAERKKRRGIASPPLGGSFTLPNITIRKKHSLPLKTIPRTFTDVDLMVAGESVLVREDGDQDKIDKITSLTLTESEWMCRTPSPVRDDPEHARFERLWSPGVDRKRPGSSLRQKAKDWYDNVRRSSSPETSPSSIFNGRGSRITGGNWI